MTVPTRASPDGPSDPLPPGPPASQADAWMRSLLAAAGAEASLRFGQVEVHRKSDGSAVTEADLAAERVLIAGIRDDFPSDTIAAEESGLDALEQGGALWLVDPIDGTSAYAEGLAHWGPTVARVVDGQVTLAALWLPRTGDYWFYERGVGSFAAGRPLARLGPGRAGRTSIAYIPSRLHLGARLRWPGKARCLGSLAAHLCLVASGAAELCLVPPGWQPWDTACGLALISAAGGLTATLDGRPLDSSALLHPDRLAAGRGGPPFAAGSPAALEWLMQPGMLTFHDDLDDRPGGPSQPGPGADG